jgi:hypothetical protein
MISFLGDQKSVTTNRGSDVTVDRVANSMPPRWRHRD